MTATEAVGPVTRRRPDPRWAGWSGARSLPPKRYTDLNIVSMPADNSESADPTGYAAPSGGPEAVRRADHADLVRCTRAAPVRMVPPPGVRPGPGDRRPVQSAGPRRGQRHAGNANAG